MLAVVVVFPHFLSYGLLFFATGTPPSLLRPVKATTSSEFFLSVALVLPSFFVTFLPRALRFLTGIFCPQAFFYLALLPHIFGTVLLLRCGQEHPTRIFLCACPHRVVPFRRTHGLIVVTRPLIYKFHQ